MQLTQPDIEDRLLEMQAANSKFAEDPRYNPATNLTTVAQSPEKLIFLRMFLILGLCFLGFGVTFKLLGLKELKYLRS